MDICCYFKKYNKPDLLELFVAYGAIRQYVSTAQSEIFQNNEYSISLEIEDKLNPVTKKILNNSVKRVIDNDKVDEDYKQEKI